MKRKILNLLILLWITLAFLSVGYNSIQAYSEYNNWFFLTDEQKRQKIFGDLYNFIIFTEEQTNGEEILLLSNDEMSYFLSRYYLYPQRIFWVKDKNQLISLVNTNKFIYIATYNNDLTIDGYEHIATFSAKTSIIFGNIYKKR